mgnify:CR=1 FL=1
METWEIVFFSIMAFYVGISVGARDLPWLFTRKDRAEARVRQAVINDEHSQWSWERHVDRRSLKDIEAEKKRVIDEGIAVLVSQPWNDDLNPR